MITIAAGATSDDVPTPCGSDAYYCTGDGTKQLVPLGHKSTGPPLLRSGYTPCVDGEYCSKGVGIPCPNATYSDHDPETNEEAEGQDACNACPAKTTSPAGSSGASSCVCMEGFIPDGDDGGKLALPCRQCSQRRRHAVRALRFQPFKNRRQSALHPMWKQSCDARDGQHLVGRLRVQGGTTSLTVAQLWPRRGRGPVDVPAAREVTSSRRTRRRAVLAVPAPTARRSRPAPDQDVCVPGAAPDKAATACATREPRPPRRQPQAVHPGFRDDCGNAPCSLLRLRLQRRRHGSRARGARTRELVATVKRSTEAYECPAAGGCPGSIARDGIEGRAAARGTSAAVRGMRRWLEPVQWPV